MAESASRVSLIAVGIVCFIVLATQVSTTPFHSDESGWVTAGGYYAGLVGRGVLSATAWEGNDLSRWGEMNPPLGKLWVGLSLRVGGAPPWFGFYDLAQSVTENAAAGRIPPDRVLRPARVGVAFAGALCCVMVFLLGRLLAGPWCGLLAAGGLLINPLFATLATQAMIDAPFAACLLGTCLGACYLLTCSGEKRMRGVLYCGALAGLAGLVKIHGLLIGVGLVVMVLLLRLPRFGVRRILILGSACAVAALAVSYAFTPSNWPQPKDFRTAPLRAEIMALRTRGVPPATGEDGRFGSFKATYPQLANLTRPLRLPFSFVRWKQFNDWLAMAHPEWVIASPRPVTQALQLFVQYASFPGEVALVCLGLVMLVNQSMGLGKSSDVALVVVTFFTVNYALILAFQSLAFERYYLMGVIAYQIPAALAAKRIVELVMRRSRKNQSALN